jgi:Toastrack DUF4097/LiaI-LiaF-like transmembrane region
MAIMSPPEPPPAPAPAPVEEVAVEAESPPPPPPEVRQAHGGVVAGLILVAIGVTALFAMWFPGGGAWLFLGLGAAFALARIVTDRPGYAVPAGLLLGFGAFVWMTETGILRGAAEGGIFFVCLGIGFLLSYAIAANPRAVWPIVPGLVMIGFGAFVQATTFGVPYAQFWWLANYWPLFLVALGAWFIFRDRLPVEARTPVALIGTAVLILLGLLVAAAAVGSAGLGYPRGPLPMPVAWPVLQAPIGNPPLQDTITLSAPTDGVSAIQLANSSGTTVVRPVAASTVTVHATRHFWTEDQAPEVQLVPNGSVLIVDTSTWNGTYVDYVVETPSALGADIRSASGAVTVSGLAGPTRIVSASGAVDARDLQGATSIETASGAIRMSNVTGELRVSSASGAIRGSAIHQVAQAHSTSGAIDLGGDFASPAQIDSTSGSVSLAFAPSASVHIEASSVSGDVRASGIELTGQSTGPHSLSGNLGGGGPTVSIHTTSGSIRLTGG